MKQKEWEKVYKENQQKLDGYRELLAIIESNIRWLLCGSIFFILMTLVSQSIVFLVMVGLVALVLTYFAIFALIIEQKIYNIDNYLEEMSRL